MKKTVLTIAALGLTFAGIAQDKYVTSALTAYSQKAYDEAKADIDKAMSSPETKEKPKALYAKVQIYYELMKMDKYKSQALYKEASVALLKLVELKPEFEKDLVNQYLMSFATMYYNDGLHAYNDDKKKNEAIDDLKAAMKIREVGGGNRYEKFAYKGRFDTLIANANLTLARIAYNEHDSLETIKLLTSVVRNPITKAKDNYYVLLEAYATANAANGNKMAAEELAAVKEARTEYPDDANIRNMEINCYSRNGRLKELVGTMEKTSEAEPNNADIVFNLGLLYQGLARPKEGPAPANAAELNGKADKAFQKAIKLAPENAGYNFGIASLYYNQAYDFNEAMAAIPGSSEKDIAQVDALKKNRDDMFAKAAPFFEKAIELYGARESTLKGNDAELYHSALVGLRQTYNAQNKVDKAKEIGAKVKAFEAKTGN